MKTRAIKLILAAIGVVIATSAQAVVALPYSSLVIFGDSLSDSGNNTLHPLIGSAAGQTSLPTFGNSYIPAQTYREFGGTASNPFATYSNGAVWSTQFAGMLGVPLSPSNVPGGTNYAFGGAVTGVDRILHPSFPQFPLPSLKTQASSYLASHPGTLPTDALYVVAGGGNNARATLDAIGLGASAGSTVFNDATRYANDIGTIVDNLQAAGATNIIVWNSPNLGTSPASLAAGALGSFLATLTADAMNAALTSRLAGEAGVKIFDIFGIANLPGASVFTNKTNACGAIGGCATSLFWDGIHPTTAAHGFIAQQMFALAVPEPSEIAMMLAGLLVVVGAARRRRIAA